jgi:hypothetical protein
MENVLVIVLKDTILFSSKIEKRILFESKSFILDIEKHFCLSLLLNCILYLKSLDSDNFFCFVKPIVKFLLFELN